MSTLHLVAPEHRQAVDAMPVFRPKHDPLERMRRDLVQVLAATPTPVHVIPEEQCVPGPEGAPDVRLLLYTPKTASDEVRLAILHFHGGGFISGTADMIAVFQQKLADDTGALVVGVDYRLAPEAPYPAALDDGYAALQWLLREARTLKVDPRRIVVMGQSAGGGLAAALALLARDRGELALAGQILIYPMLDARTGTGGASQDNASIGEFVWTREVNRFAWAAYDGGADRLGQMDGRYSPALATDVAGLPRTFIGVGSLDLFLEEDVAYALKLFRAGIRTELRVYDGGVHAFDFLPGPLQERFTADVSQAIRGFIQSADSCEPTR